MLHQPKPDEAPDLLAGIIAIRKMHIRAIEESGLTGADEMLYPENRSYLDDILSYEQSEQDLWKSAASSDGKRYGYSDRNEEPDKRRFFCNAQFCSGSTEFSFFYIQGNGCDDRGK